MKTAAILAFLLALPAAAAAAPSVEVTTTMPLRGTRPERIVAYGTVRPAIDAASSISEPVEGQVAAIAVTPGERVHAGQDLFTFRPSAATISRYNQAVTALNTAEAARTHTAQLLAGHLATRDQLIAAGQSVADARSTLETLKRGGAAGPRQITAPVDGIVDTIPVSQGGRLPPGTTLLSLTASDGLVATVGIDPGERARVDTGDLATLSDLAGGATLSGHVIRVDGRLDLGTRMVDVDLSVPADAVLAGEALKAVITVRVVHGWLVPHEAVLTDSNSSSLYQVSDGKAVQVPVKILLVDGDVDVVSGRLDPHRPVVAAGAYQLNSGMAVRPGKPS